MDLKKNSKCDLCGEDSKKFLYSMPDLRHGVFWPEYSVVECYSCGHRYLFPMPSKTELNVFYPQKYYSKRSATELLNKQRYLRQAEYLPAIKGRILDIGCAGGAWLSVVKNMGWECFGTDFFSAEDKNKDIDIKIGSLPDIGYEYSFFDVATAWGVMEHVDSPLSYFKEIHRILRSGGILIIMVPNGDSLWSRWAYKEDIPRHIHFFRKKTLAMYAEKSGFVLERIHCTNYIYSRPATGRGLFALRMAKFFGASWKDISENTLSGISKYASLIGRLFDRLIIPEIEELFDSCGNMIVILRKK